VVAFDRQPNVVEIRPNCRLLLVRDTLKFPNTTVTTGRVKGLDPTAAALSWFRV